jgi:hypothetical protein
MVSHDTVLVPLPAIDQEIRRLLLYPLSYEGMAFELRPRQVYLAGTKGRFASSITLMPKIAR